MLDVTVAASVGEATDVSSARDAADWDPGATLGRYVLLGRIGSGAMGVVYAAYDPELDRKVAIKCVAAREATAGDRTRLVREAQALAKLSHPNAVAVHDAGTRDDAVWLAMEYVEGLTLDRWLGARARTTAEILEVLQAIAQGLAAAHRAGIVHRDVKPANVMLGDDGRVRVMDFGLARAFDSADLPAEAPESSSPSALSRSATRVGARPGTPAYMAPEQHAGGTADARSDQFAFCVTAWEALYGERPFAGDSVVEIATNVLHATLREPSTGVAVPRWVRRVLERGLAREPDQRWPSMSALTEAIAAGERATRRNRWFAMAAALGAIAIGGASLHAVSQRAARAACRERGAAIDEVWRPEIAEQVRERLRGSGVTFAQTTADHVTPWLDDYAVRWRDAVSSACTSDRARPVEPAIAQAQQWCFAQRRDQLASVVEPLLEPDVMRIQAALDAVSGLDPIEMCSDEAHLSRIPVPPVEHRDAIAALTRECARLDNAPGNDDTEQRARGVLAQAEAIGWPPLVARARASVGAVLRHRSDSAAAEAAYEPAFFTAAAAGDYVLATQIAVVLTDIVGDDLARPDEGMRWSRLGDLMRAFVPDPTRALVSSGLAARGVVSLRKGDFAQARADLEQSIAVLEAAVPGHPAIARRRANLAIALAQQGLVEEAAEAFDAARLALIESRGADHPAIGQILHNRANLELQRHRYEAAQATFEEALALRQAALGPDHLEVAQTLAGLATLYMSQGQSDRARDAYERALAVKRRWLGDEHPDLAGTMHNLAILHKRGNDRATALALHRQALEIERQHQSEAHPSLARSLVVYGETLTYFAEYDLARAAFAESIAIAERSFGARHHELAAALRDMVKLELLQGHPDAALAAAERANGLERLDRLGPSVVAETRLTLAEATLAARGDAAAANAIVRDALLVLRGAEPTAREIARLEQWLGEHGG